MGPAAQVQPLVGPIERPLDYAVPTELADRIDLGSMVAVSLGRRRVPGVVLGLDPPTHDGRLAPISGLLDLAPLSEELIDLAGWVAEYYASTRAAALRLVLPPGADGPVREGPDGLWRVKGVSQGETNLIARVGEPGGTARQQEVTAVLTEADGELSAAELCRRARTTMPTLRRMDEAGLLSLGRSRRSGLDWFGEAEPGPDTPPVLTAEQDAAVAALDKRLDGGGPVLLHGVTGSGKTEVYLRAILAARARGRSSLVLAPEIALTPQLLRRLRARLGEGIAVWHSGLSVAERAAEYARIREGDADVVLGARSAVFAPVANLGLVIVDEEHDASYKQDSAPRYDARRVAWYRANQADAALVYGSATPRPETWHALPRISLAQRADGAALPQVDLVDMRTQSAGPISRPLAQALRTATDRGEKAIVLMNRRGFALGLLCSSCGWIAGCPSCDVGLVIHRTPERLACHHCGHEAEVPVRCPECDSSQLMRQGSGTQGAEEALRELLPKARLVRLDASTAGGRGEITRLLEEFSQPGGAVLLGTQMVAKGHDLPDVTVAGVLAADAALARPDFRAEERTFGLVVQLAGRAGRRGEPARVIVQAWEPGARALQLATQHAVTDFVTAELVARDRHGFPPFGHLVRLVLSGPEAGPLADYSTALADEVREAGVVVLGPAPMHRLRGRHRRSILARAARAEHARGPMLAALTSRKADLKAADIRVAIDVDPQDT